MPEIRYNLITRQWVIIATERARRPEEFGKKGKEAKEIPAFIETCPFCPGNEDKTPAHLVAIPAEGQWQVRVIPNKFSALAREGPLTRSISGIKRSMSGVGLHDVVIETPDHSKTTALLAEKDVETIFEAYRRRYAAMDADDRIEQITIFKNHGEAAGTSLEHPHSQIIGTPVIPVDVRDRLEGALHHYDQTGECLFCRMLELEIKEGARVVEETEHFAWFVPYAALTPFHSWIFPKQHRASFAEASDAEMTDLARFLRRSLRRIYKGLDNPDFNYTIRTAPRESGNVRYYHWYLSIVLRLTKLAGFELGSGMFINVALPEASAKFLRDTSPD